MSEECACGSCQGDGYNAYAELRERVRTQVVCLTVPLEDRQAAAIEELVALIGYLPQAHAVLERHGLR